MTRILTILKSEVVCSPFTFRAFSSVKPSRLALPFEISPAEAAQTAATYVPLKASGRRIGALLGSLANRILPGLGLKSFMPKEIHPVYFPCWFVDADISINTVIGGLTIDSKVVPTRIQSINS